MWSRYLLQFSHVTITTVWQSYFSMDEQIYNGLPLLLNFILCHTNSQMDDYSVKNEWFLPLRQVIEKILLAAHVALLPGCNNWIMYKRMGIMQMHCIGYTHEDWKDQLPNWILVGSFSSYAVISFFVKLVKWSFPFCLFNLFCRYKFKFQIPSYFSLVIRR